MRKLQSGYGSFFSQDNKQRMGAQWVSGRVLDSRLRGCGFETHWHHCIVSLSKNINPSLVLVLPRKTRPFINERLSSLRKALFIVPLAFKPRGI